MEVELKSREIIDLKYGNLVLEGFAVKSEWHGMKELVSPKYGTVIMEWPTLPQIKQIMDDICNPEKTAKPITGTIVKSSSDIAAKLKAAEEAMQKEEKDKP